VARGAAAGAAQSVKVNLIPWNPGELPYHESPAERIEEFRRILVDRGVPTFCALLARARRDGRVRAVGAFANR